MKIKLPSSTNNLISLIGATLAVIMLFMIVFLFVISTVFNQGGTYLGLIIYIVLPIFLVIGLILIPIGMIRKSRKDKKAEPGAKERWPLIDLNNIRNRHAFFIFSVGTVIFLFLSAIGSYEAFEYTESVEFCGTLCHNVMHPEYTAYQNSAHAKVACVDCHVGSGADWFVRSKLSGLYQVYAVTLGSYPKPIPTPISNLRPARETCEECHWPEKFYARKLRLEKHYLADEQNTEWDIQLLMKIGGPHSAMGLKEGIHWHINPNTKIEYVASDEKRQQIPHIKYTNRATGEVTIYESSDNPLSKEMLDSLKVREMECIDCHNRPSHNYQPPAFFVNNALTAGTIPKELPEIKSLLMEISDKQFSTTDSMMRYAVDQINSFYKDKYPDIVSAKKYLIDNAINGFKTEYKKNIFPEMKVRWDVYPNNIGHVEFNGCFRCHDDNHMSTDGKTISKDCNLCHNIVAQGYPDSLQVANINQFLEFRHPTDIEDAWKEMLCTECHTGLNP